MALSGSRGGQSGEKEKVRVRDHANLGSNHSSTTYLLAMKSKHLAQSLDIVSAQNIC